MSANIVSREDTWVSIAQAAAHLGVNARTLRRYIHGGRISVVRLSPQVVRITPEALAEFEKRNLKVQTGTGTCYVVRPEPEPEKPQVKPGKPAHFSG